MRVLLVAYGTAGNFLPLAGLGLALRNRGHDVVFIGNRAAEPLARREQFPFVEFDSPLLAGHEAPPPSSSTLTLLRFFRQASADLLRRMYETLAALHEPGRTVAVAQGWLFGARIAQERLGIPLATVHLQPVMFGNLHEPEILPGPLGFCLRWLRRKMVLRIADRSLAGDLNRFRAELGLAPVRGVLGTWWRSPQLVLAMFPAWFSPPRRDWPAQTRLIGFPQFDRLQEPGDLCALENFLAAGSPPLVFSSPTLLATTSDYLTTCAEIARSLGRRAILLSLKAAALPQSLPDGVRYFGYVPLSLLLPRAAALIHHGGIGSIALALAAGIPQVTVPAFLDQADNSRRLARLGTSAVVHRRQYRPALVAGKLGQLLESAEVAAHCARYAGLCRQDDCYANAALALEGLLP